MGYYDTFTKRLASGREFFVRMIATIGSAVLSNRGLVVCALLGCALLSLGPWLRPPMSRDFRGGQIPWNTSGQEWFVPENAAPTPRPWRWDGVAVPLFLLAAGGAVVTAFRPRLAPAAFGLVLAMSLPATAAVLWNHPTIVEYFETELRGRLLLRKVFRAESRDLLVGDSPDRLAQRWGKDTKAELVPTEHPMLRPMRYTVYGPWLIVVSAAGIVITSAGAWTSRFGRVAAWGAVGAVVAIAVTLPRLKAEYHWIEAADSEQANQFDSALAHLDQAREAMPELATTRRYWRDRGRLDYRLGAESRYRTFFEAHQLGLIRKYQEAYALLSELVAAQEGDAVERDLMAEFLSEVAAVQAQTENFASAERKWEEAAELVPWNPVYWLGGATMALWGDPVRAAEVERDVIPRMAQIGDRVMNSDIASLIGDAYFKTGSFHEARGMYSLSLANFNLPKHVNLRAQHGRLGM